MITGINHITLSVNDIDQSFDFYVGVLGLRPVMKSKRSAYLLAGETWIALVKDRNTHANELAEYTHFAFTVSKDDFGIIGERILRSGVTIWQENRSEGESLYFLDPNGQKLEINASDLGTRLEALKKENIDEMELFD